LKRLWNRYTRALVIFGFAVIATIAAYIMGGNYIESKTQTEWIPVPKDHIKPYSSLKDNLIYRDVVLSEIPQDAIKTIEEYESWYVGEYGLIRNTPIRKSMITSAKDSKFGAAIDLQQSYYVGVITDQARSAGDTIKPGVLADAYVYIKGDQQKPAQTITARDNPNLANLLVFDRQNQEGVPPGEVDGKSLIPSIVVIETTNPDVASDLVRYQEEGKIYFSPKGVDKDFVFNQKEDPTKVKFETNNESLPTQTPAN